MKKNKTNKKKMIKIMIILCVILILCLLFLLIYLKNANKNEEQVKIVTTEEQEEAVTNYVRTRGEKERMQVYLAEYIKHIERKEYDQAYNLLYPQFKENYFNTKEEYIWYVEKNYSDLMMIEYDNIERQGNYYILSITITNLGEIETQKSQKFIIYENGLNDYYISFQAK